VLLVLAVLLRVLQVPVLLGQVLLLLLCQHARLLLVG
jgi:hypothetical protein